MTFLDLLQGIRIVVRCDRNVSAVDHLAPEVKGVAIKWSGSVSGECSLRASQTYTLYPPLNPNLREPCCQTEVSR